MSNKEVAVAVEEQAERRNYTCAVHSAINIEIYVTTKSRYRARLPVCR